jgi:hypothetical protein
MDTPLQTVRRAIERLSTANGPYRIVDARTGTSPVPVQRAQFATYGEALLATTLAAAYRRALRRWDERTPSYTLVVERCGNTARVASRQEYPAERKPATERGSL